MVVCSTIAPVKVDDAPAKGGGGVHVPGVVTWPIRRTRSVYRNEHMQYCLLNDCRLVHLPSLLHPGQNACGGVGDTRNLVYLGKYWANHDNRLETSQHKPE